VLGKKFAPHNSGKCKYFVGAHLQMCVAGKLMRLSGPTVGLVNKLNMF